MRFRLDDIEAFLLVMETSSVSGAALRLGLSKSVISKRLTDLERTLGVQLLRRSTRGVIPTEKGHSFYQQARDFMQQLDTAAESTADTNTELTGQVRIAAPMSFGNMYLSSVLFEFASRHPGLNLELELDDRKVDIEAGGFDLAIRVTQLKDSSLIARKLALSRRVVICSPAYAAEHGLPKSLDDVANHRCIGYAHVHSGQLWQFEPKRRSGKVRSVVTRSAMVLNNGEAMRDAAIAGIGMCMVPLFIAAPALRDGRLINALPNERPTSDFIYAVYPKTAVQSRKVRMIVDYLRDYLSGPLPWEQ
jgi:DNA-binding transcriptional LysR family regulator